ncbi:MAG TPA: hypothetical protein VFE62_19405 [Gemmataceae bacterium]|nr:hypothetical protein [Gemmataceae bacterium]
MRMIALLCFVILLFGAAAGGSWYLQSMQNKDKDGESKTAEDKEKPTKPAHPTAIKHVSGEGSKPIMRPSSSNDTEHLTKLAASLEQRKEQLNTRAKELELRGKQMNIVHDEIKKEQTKLNVMRKEIQVELLRVQEKLDELDKKLAAVQSEQKNSVMQAKALHDARIDVSDREWANLKVLFKTVEKMDPDAAASTIIDMSNSGKIETAVKLLSMIRDRQAAAIFAEIQKQDEKLPGQLFERLLTLKTPAMSAEKGAAN